MTSKLSIRYLPTLIITLFALALAGAPAQAEDWSKLDAKKQSRLGMYMTAADSYKYTMEHMDKTLFLDIRTPEELNFLGAPTVMDANVPSKLLDTGAWDDKKHNYKEVVNPNFVAEVDARRAAKGLGKDDTVILMCRSGNRSAEAANWLADAGYTHVYSVVDGYEGDKAKEGTDKGKRVINGWKNAGLPWTYSLDRDLMYFPK